MKPQRHRAPGRRQRLAGSATVPYLLFAIAALNVLTWFPHGYPIGWGDAGLTAYGYSPLTLVRTAIDTWNPLNQLGTPSASTLAAIPTALFFSVGRTIGIQAWIAQAILYWSVQFVGMASMYALLGRLLAASPTRRLAAMTGALLYNFLPLTFENYWMIGNSSIMLVAFIPLLLLVLLRLPDSSVARGALELSGVLLCCMSAYQNPAYGLPVAGLGLVLLARYLYSLHDRQHPGDLARLVGRLALSATTVILLFSWYLGPIATQLTSYYGEAVTQASPITTLVTADLNVNWLSLLLLRAFRTNSPSFAPYWAPSWRFAYNSPLFLALALIIVLFMATGALANPSRQPSLLGLGLFALGFFLCLGGNAPFGAVYRFLLLRVPLFGSFRDPTNKWTPVLVFGAVLLFAIGVDCVLRRTAIAASNYQSRQRVASGALRVPLREPGLRRNVLQAGLIAILLGVTFGYGFPMLTGGPGDPQIKGSGYTLQRGIDPPRQFSLARNYLTSHSTGLYRVLILPLSYSGYRWFRWPAGYDGPDYSWLQFDVPTLSSPFLQSPGPASTFLNDLSSLDLTQRLFLAGELSCRYVLLEADATATGYSYSEGPVHSLRSDQKALVSLGARLVFSDRPLLIYELPARLVRPPVSMTALDSGRTVAMRSNLGWFGKVTASSSTLRGRSILLVNVAYSSSASLSLRFWDRTKLVKRVWLGKPLLVDGYADGWILPTAPRSAGRISVQLSMPAAGLFGTGLCLGVVTLCGLLLSSIPQLRTGSRGLASALRRRRM